MRMAGEHAYYYKCTYIRIMCVQHANYMCAYILSKCVRGVYGAGRAYVLYAFLCIQIYVYTFVLIMSTYVYINIRIFIYTLVHAYYTYA